MSKLNISGYQKFSGLQLGNWKCSITTETEEVYTFLFDFHPNDEYFEHQDFFNLVVINRKYSDPDGFLLTVDFNIVRNDGYIEEFKNVRNKWIYAHDLITLKKAEALFEPLLKLNA